MLPAKCPHCNLLLSTAERTAGHCPGCGFREGGGPPVQAEAVSPPASTAAGTPPLAGSPAADAPTAPGPPAASSPAAAPPATSQPPGTTSTGQPMTAAPTAGGPPVAASTAYSTPAPGPTSQSIEAYRDRRQRMGWATTRSGLLLLHLGLVITPVVFFAIFLLQMNMNPRSPGAAVRTLQILLGSGMLLAAFMIVFGIAFGAASPNAGAKAWSIIFLVSTLLMVVAFSANSAMKLENQRESFREESAARLARIRNEPIPVVRSQHSEASMRFTLWVTLGLTVLAQVAQHFYLFVVSKAMGRTGAAITALVLLPFALALMFVLFFAPAFEWRPLASLELKFWQQQLVVGIAITLVLLAQAVVAILAKAGITRYLLRDPELNAAS